MLCKRSRKRVQSYERDLAFSGAVFPGRNAGASLKQLFRFVAFLPPYVFPGRNAGASLKPVQTPAEAVRALWSSPAEMPGPH